MLGTAPEAIFDPYYIPPQLLFRDSEKQVLRGMLLDSIEDKYTINVIITGHNGIGKTVLGNYTLNRELSVDYKMYFSDTTYSTVQEIFEGFAISLGIPPHETTTATISEIEKYSRKHPSEIILFLDNINIRNVNMYKKVARRTKQAKITTIATMDYNTYYTLKKIETDREFIDMALQLGMYTEAQLVEIAKQKVRLAFPVHIHDELIEYMTDIIAEFDYTRPGTIVELLRLLFKEVIRGNKKINTCIIRNACYELGLEGDNIFFFEELPNMTIEEITFLERINEIFLKETSEPYIDLDTLNGIFIDIANQFGLEYDNNLFRRLMYKVLDLGILIESKIKPYSYFTITDPVLLHEVIRRNKFQNMR